MYLVWDGKIMKVPKASVRVSMFSPPVFDIGQTRLAHLVSKGFRRSGFGPPRFI